MLICICNWAHSNRYSELLANFHLIMRSLSVVKFFIPMHNLTLDVLAIGHGTSDRYR